MWQLIVPPWYFRSAGISTSCPVTPTSVVWIKFTENDIKLVWRQPLLLFGLKLASVCTQGQYYHCVTLYITKENWPAHNCGLAFTFLKKTATVFYLTSSRNLIVSYNWFARLDITIWIFLYYFQIQLNKYNECSSLVHLFFFFSLWLRFMAEFCNLSATLTPFVYMMGLPRPNL